MIGDDVAAALPEFRRQAESLMFDTCVVTRGTGSDTDDEGRVTQTSTPIYGPDLAPHAGKCKISGDRAYEVNRDVVGAAVSIQRYLFHAPVTAGPFEEGDVVTIVASKTQPHLVNNVYRIAGRDERSTQTSQRMYVEFI